MYLLSSLFTRNGNINTSKTTNFLSKKGDVPSEMSSSKLRSGASELCLSFVIPKSWDSNYKGLPTRIIKETAARWVLSARIPEFVVFNFVLKAYAIAPLINPPKYTNAHWFHLRRIGFKPVKIWIRNRGTAIENTLHVRMAAIKSMTSYGFTLTSLMLETASPR